MWRAIHTCHITLINGAQGKLNTVFWHNVCFYQTECLLLQK